METTFDMTPKEWNELKKMVQRIETAVLGDECAGIDGMVKRVDKHDRQLTNIQRIQWVSVGVVGVIAVGWEILKFIKS